MMGMYTELFLRCDVKGVEGDPHIDALVALAAGEADWQNPPGHEHLCVLGSLGGYFPASSHGVRLFQHSGYRDQWSLIVLGTRKNYGNEFQSVLEWLAPHIDTDSRSLGWIMYEEDTAPTLIYKRYGSETIEYVRPGSEQ